MKLFYIWLFIINPIILILLVYKCDIYEKIYGHKYKEVDSNGWNLKKEYNLKDNSKVSQYKICGAILINTYES